MIEKLHAATDARTDEGFVIVARTDANASLGIQAAIERAAVYLEHGADLTFVEAPRDEAQLGRIAREVPGPTMVNMVEGGNTPLLGLDRLGEMGFAVVLYANAGLRAAMKGMIDVLAHLKAEGSTLGVLDRILPWEERQAIVGKDAFLALAESYADQAPSEPPAG
jgi:2-methylisocitrate lyase-like PEP mutase family enzyme